VSERIDALVDDREDRSVKLKVNGLLFGGWKQLRAEVGIEQCSGAFELSVMDRWAEQAQAWQIKPGDDCELLMANQTVITGYVDAVRPHIEKAAHSIRISGRDRTMDLIDCSAIYKSGQWKGVKLDRIARDIARPFSIEVSAVGDMGDVFDSFHIEEGERAFETIDRAARMRSRLVTTDGTGRLIITTASKGKAVATLAEGDNIYSAELDVSWKERYSEIIVKGQGKGDDKEYGEKVAHGKASSKDEAIKRYRPLIVIAEHHAKGPKLSQRAEWERNVRRGRGTRSTIKVQGWTKPDGTLWKPNELASVLSPTLYIEQDLLIAKCVYTLAENGTFTEMQLVHPAAFDILKGVKGTRLDKRIRGADGLEDNRQHAKHKARGDKGQGEVVDLGTGGTR
jgi:prophage tail gpP-like protein